MGVRGVVSGVLDGVSNRFRRMVASDGGHNSTAAVQQHTQAPMMRESEVRGKLIRFLSGMRAYEQQQSTSGGSGRPLPPVLAQFIQWSGSFVTTGHAPPQRSTAEGDSSEAAARQYVGPNANLGVAVAGAYEEPEVCTICLESLGDVSLWETHGEPIQTICGHHFHAVCFARHMENSHQDPWCPMCRGRDIAIRF